MKVTFGSNEDTASDSPAPVSQAEGTAPAAPPAPKRRRGRISVWEPQQAQLAAMPVASSVESAQWLTFTLETAAQVEGLIVYLYRIGLRDGNGDWRAMIHRVSETEIRACRIKPDCATAYQTLYNAILALPVAENTKDAQWTAHSRETKEDTISMCAAVYQWGKKTGGTEWRVRTKRDSDTQISFCRTMPKQEKATPCYETPQNAPEATCSGETASAPCSEASKPCEASSVSGEATNAPVEAPAAPVEPERE